MRNVYQKSERAVSAIIGTLLLIAITVVLVTTIGIFIIKNVPSQPSSIPSYQLVMERIPSKDTNAVLLYVQQNTKNVYIGNFKLEIIFQKYSHPIYINLYQTSSIYVPPLYLKYVNINPTERDTFEYLNSSMGLCIFSPLSLNVSYVNLIDEGVNSVVGQTAVSNPLNYNQTSGNVYSYYYVSTFDTNITNPTISYKYSGIYELSDYKNNITFAYNNSDDSFNIFGVSGQKYPFYELDGVNNSYWFEFSIPIYLPNENNVTIKLYDTEPGYLYLINNTGSFQPFKINVTPSENFSSSFSGKMSGIIIIDGLFQYKYSNEKIAVNVEY
ncbi:type IV pilin [Caldiplasma sukawensis]